MNLQYKTLLSLDGFTQILNQGERIIAIRMMLNQEAELTEKMQKALNLIDYHKWEPPKFNVGHDRLTYFRNKETDNWQPIEQYKHPIINETQKLK